MPPYAGQQRRERRGLRGRPSMNGSTGAGWVSDPVSESNRSLPPRAIERHSSDRPRTSRYVVAIRPRCPAMSCRPATGDPERPTQGGGSTKDRHYRRRPRLVHAGTYSCSEGSRSTSRNLTIRLRYRSRGIHRDRTYRSPFIRPGIDLDRSECHVTRGRDAIATAACAQTRSSRPDLWAVGERGFR